MTTPTPTPTPTPTQSKIDVGTLIAAALAHGQNSEPDHEAGDLQEYMSSAWALMSIELQNSALAHPRLSTALKTATLGVPFLGKPDTPSGEELLEKVFEIFKEHGSYEGAHAEIQDLQDALWSVWDVLPPEKREQMLNMPCVQETYFNATSKHLYRYVACAYWGHIFGPTAREDMTRWVFDRDEEKLVKAQVQYQSDWVNLESLPFADLMESLKDNDVSISQDESDFGEDFHYFAKVPSWDELSDAFEAQCYDRAKSQGEDNEDDENDRDRILLDI
jgi:hypothetical protein